MNIYYLSSAGAVVGEYRPEIMVMVREEKANYDNGNNENG